MAEEFPRHVFFSLSFARVFFFGGALSTRAHACVCVCVLFCVIHSCCGHWRSAFSIQQICESKLLAHMTAVTPKKWEFQGSSNAATEKKCTWSHPSRTVNFFAFLPRDWTEYVLSHLYSVRKARIYRTLELWVRVIIVSPIEFFRFRVCVSPIFSHSNVFQAFFISMLCFGTPEPSSDNQCGLCWRERE